MQSWKKKTEKRRKRLGRPPKFRGNGCYVLLKPKGGGPNRSITVRGTVESIIAKLGTSNGTLT